MKLYLSVLLTVSVSLSSVASEALVKLPTKAVIAQRLREKALDHFLEKTKLDDKLGGKELYPLGVSLAVELALYDYDQYLQNPMVAKVLQMRKYELIEVFLKDSPAALANLQKHGVYKAEDKKQK